MREIVVAGGETVAEVARLLRTSDLDVIGFCFREMGLMVTAIDPLSFGEIREVAESYGLSVRRRPGR